MQVINVKTLRRKVDQAVVAGKRERERRRAFHEKCQADEIEREKPVQLARARKLLRELPNLIEKATADNRGEFFVMSLLLADYDFDKIPPHERSLPSAEAQRVLRHGGWSNEKPYLTMRKHLKPYSAAALVFDACDRLGLGPHLVVSSTCSVKEAGAMIFCSAR